MSMKKMIFILLLLLRAYDTSADNCENNYIYFDNQKIINCSDSILKKLSTITDIKEQIAFIDCVGQNRNTLCPWDGLGDISMSVFNLYFSEKNKALHQCFFVFFTQYYPVSWGEIYSEFSKKLKTFLREKNIKKLDQDELYKLYEITALMRSETFKEDNLFYEQLSKTLIVEMRDSDSAKSTVSDYSIEMGINQYVFHNQVDSSALRHLLFTYHNDNDKINKEIEQWIIKTKWPSYTKNQKQRLFRFLYLFRSHKMYKNTLIFFDQCPKYL